MFCVAKTLLKKDNKRCNYLYRRGDLKHTNIIKNYLFQTY